MIPKLVIEHHKYREKENEKTIVEQQRVLRVVKELLEKCLYIEWRHLVLVR